jgi:hypothetical protein
MPSGSRCHFGIRFAFAKSVARNRVGKIDVARETRLEDKSCSINRHCEQSEAIHLTLERKNGLLRRFAPRNDAEIAVTI